MTTIQARSWTNAEKRTAKARDHGGLHEKARTAIGIALLVVLLAAAVAIRVLVYVHL